MRLRLGMLMVVGAMAVLLAGCGGGSTSARTSTASSESEPTSLSGCVEAWDSQAMGLPKESAELAVAEGDYEAWVSVYRGEPITLKTGDGFESKFAGRHCLVAIPGARWVYAYKDEEWRPSSEAGTPLYEYATDAATASEAEIVKGVHLQIVSDETSGSAPDLTRCQNLWNGNKNTKPQSEIGSLEPTSVNVSISGTFPDRCLVTVANGRIGLAAEFLQAEPGSAYAYEVIYSGESEKVPSHILRSNARLVAQGLVELTGLVKSPTTDEQAETEEGSRKEGEPTSVGSADTSAEEAGHPLIRTVEFGLRSHFDYLEAGQYEKAYEGLTAQEGESLGGEAEWIADQEQDPLNRYELSVSVEFTGSRRAEAEIDEFRTRSQETGCQSWTGGWGMVEDGGRWRIANAKLGPGPC